MTDTLGCCGPPIPLMILPALGYMVGSRPKSSKYAEYWEVHRIHVRFGHAPTLTSKSLGVLMPIGRV